MLKAKNKEKILKMVERKRTQAFKKSPLTLVAESSSETVEASHSRGDMYIQGAKSTTVSQESFFNKALFQNRGKVDILR